MQQSSPERLRRDSPARMFQPSLDESRVILNAEMMLAREALSHSDDGNKLQQISWGAR